jgi:hypothetical protein
MQFVRSLLSRTLDQLTRPSSPRGAAWRSLSEFQACLATHGHELLVEHHAPYMEGTGHVAGGISGTAGSAHEDVSPAIPMRSA